MIQPGGDRGFSPQPLDRCRVAGQPGYENLDRNGFSGVDLMCLVDVRHPSFAQLTVDLVPLVEDLAGKTSEGSRAVG
jgi:hypothetical protein